MVKIIIFFVCVMQAIYGDINNIDDEIYKSCEKKDARSCMYIAKMHLRQEPNDYNIKTTLNYHEKACIYGDIQACYQLGRLYHLKKLIPKDYKLSLKYYKKACKENHAQACNNIGSHYKYGYGVKFDYDKALKFYEKSYGLKVKNATYRNIKHIKGLIEDRYSCEKNGYTWNYFRRDCE